MSIFKSSLLMIGLFSSSVYAADSNVSVNCQPISIAPALGLVDVYLAKNSGTLADASAPYEITALQRSSSDYTTVAGLKVKLLKAVAVDSFSKTNFGWVRQTTKTKVFAAKFSISADEVISYEIQGDVGVPVHSQEVYTICNEQESFIAVQ